MRRLLVFLAAVCWLPVPAAGADAVDYLRDVKPLLKQRCFACHGALKQKGNLRLDAAALIRKGGRHGPAVVPGNAAGSLLVERVTDAEPSSRMPPEGQPLTTEQITLLKTWIDRGAPAPADEKPEEDPRQHWVVGLIPKARQPITLDGNLGEWTGAFVTPVHVGHPDFTNRGGQFLYLWDEKNLYIGLRCLDRKPAHVGKDNAIWNGDAVEFYLDTRRGDQLGEKAFGPGTLHMFWTPFTGTDVKPRMGLRDIPAFKGFKLQGAEVAGAKTPWGYTAEFNLPWSNFPDFTPKAGEVIGVECELCSSDGGPRVDRTFTYASPAAVGSPSAFGRVKLVDQFEPAALKPLGRVLLPLALNQSRNYPWLYGTVCVSPSLEGAVAKLEGKLLDAQGKVRKTSAGTHKALVGTGFTLWSASWELFDLPSGEYTLELTALDKNGNVLTSRSEKAQHTKTVP